MSFLAVFSGWRWRLSIDETLLSFMVAARAWAGVRGWAATMAVMDCMHPWRLRAYFCKDEAKFGMAIAWRTIDGLGERELAQLVARLAERGAALASDDCPTPLVEEEMKHAGPA